MKSSYILTMMIYLKIILMIFMILCISIQLFNKNIHPLNYMFTFMIFTFMMMYITYFNLNHSLYPMMILISMIGGVMILFNYFLSLINNEKSKMIYFNYLIMLLYILLFFMFLSIILIYYKNYFMMNFLNSSLLLKTNLNIFKIYVYPTYYLTIMMMLMLLLIMILSFKMCTFKFKPLRKLKK